MQNENSINSAALHTQFHILFFSGLNTQVNSLMFCDKFAENFHLDYKQWTILLWITGLYKQNSQ